jgi:CubicO group peptidase (beta-lactamase class C family)
LRFRSNISLGEFWRDVLVITGVMAASLCACSGYRGANKSIDDPVDKYLPYLASSGYRGVTIRSILEVPTGADYSEEYRDPHSGAAIIGAAIVSGKPAFKDFVASMKPTDTKPRTQFNYQSVNTQVLGLLLEKVTGPV